MHAILMPNAMVLLHVFEILSSKQAFFSFQNVDGMPSKRDVLQCCKITMTKQRRAGIGQDWACLAAGRWKIPSGLV